MNLFKLTAIGILSLWLIGCSTEPKVIHYGSERCDHCQMVIADKEFASQLVTDNGKAFKFDSIECLAAHTMQHRHDLPQNYVSYVPDFSNPGDWMKANESRFLKTPQINSPMGMSLIAIPKEKLPKYSENFGGQQLNWTGVKELVEREWDIER